VRGVVYVRVPEAGVQREENENPHRRAQTRGLRRRQLLAVDQHEYQQCARHAEDRTRRAGTVEAGLREHACDTAGQPREYVQREKALTAVEALRRASEHEQHEHVAHQVLQAEVNEDRGDEAPRFSLFFECAWGAASF
jgi:hypothetical protein